MNARSKNLGMILLVLFVAASLVFNFSARPAAAAPAVVCTSIANGDWDVAGTWSCAAVPGLLDTVVIDHVVTIPATMVTDPIDIAGITIGATGQLILPDQNITVPDGTPITIAAGGKITQQRLISSLDGVVDFATIYEFTSGNPVYQGVSIGTDVDTDLVVTIGSNDPICTSTGVENPDYRDRCILVTNNTVNTTGTLVVYTSATEDDIEGPAIFDTLYRFDGSAWVYWGDCGSVDADPCISTVPNPLLLLGNNYFLVGLDTAAPTAVGLAKLAAAGGAQPFALAGLVLAFGLVGAFAWKRSTKK